MNKELVATIVVLICLVIFLIVLLKNFSKKENKKAINFLEEHSISINNLKSINEKYKFYNLAETEYTKIYDNEAVYNNISCEDILIYQLQTDKRDILDSINKIEYNKKHYEKYINEITKCKEFGNYDITTNEKKLKKLITLEKQFYEKNIKHPKIEYFIKVITTNIAKNGYVKDTKEEVFNKNKVLSCINELNKKEGTFYLNKDYWNSICRVERGKVTNKLRLEIFERDNYTCKCCGKKEEIENLEVDHILPISKGGKSTLNNLQTLCRDCNLAKGIKYIKYK